MRILLVTHFLPYPPSDGGRIGYYNPIKYLSARHEIILLSLARPDDGANISALRSMCADVITSVDRGWTARSLMRGVFGSPPGTAGKYSSNEFSDLFERATKRYRPDIIELEHLNTAWLLAHCDRSCPVILREHNIEFKVWERQAEHTANPVARIALNLQAGRVRKFEAEMAARFDHCITVSEADKNYLKEVSPRAAITAIPSGVDTEYFCPMPEAEEVPFSMVMTGSFAWRPKQHNLRIVLSEIFPRIRTLLPEASLTIVGKGVPPYLKQLAQKHGVTVTGAVPDVRPYISSASLILNYLESGGGIALKVLEAMAMRKPVLTNALGVEGISLRPGRDAEVVNSISDFAVAAQRLLVDSDHRRALAENGCALVKEEYSWHKLAGRFEALYEQSLSESSTSAMKPAFAT